MMDVVQRTAGLAQWLEHTEVAVATLSVSAIDMSLRELKVRQTHTHRHTHTHTHTDTHTDTHTHTHRQTDTDTQTDRQTDRHAHRDTQTHTPASLTKCIDSIQEKKGNTLV